MHDRIPPSLAWLVKRRRSIAGRLEAARKVKLHLEVEVPKQIAVKAAEIQILERDLAAISAVIQMHEIVVDPNELGTTRVQRRPRRSGYGAMTSAILSCLAKVYPQSLNTDEITAAVSVQCNWTTVQDRFESRIPVRKLLGKMSITGKVVRLHAPYGGGHQMGRWCLAPSMIESPQKTRWGRAPKTAEVENF